MNVTTVGSDLAKNVFQVHGVDAEGRVVLRKRLRRVEVIPFFANLSPWHRQVDGVTLPWSG